METAMANNPVEAALKFHTEALNLRAYRQQLLASNIANADTPNYKARDIDFQKTLTAAFDRIQNRTLGAAASGARHAGKAGQAGPAAAGDDAPRAEVAPG